MWYYDCVNVSYTVIFLCVCMFMTCSTSYCLVTLKNLWNIYICMYRYSCYKLPSVVATSATTITFMKIFAYIQIV